MTEFELVLLEQGERVSLYAKWPTLFTVALGSRRYPDMSRFLTELHNAVVDAHRRRCAS